MRITTPNPAAMRVPTFQLFMIVSPFHCYVLLAGMPVVLNTASEVFAHPLPHGSGSPPNRARKQADFRKQL